MDTEKKLATIIDANITIKNCEISGHKINYMVAGDGPPLLLIHGANFGWGMWYPNISELAKHFTVYAIDLPGAGRSSRIDYSKLDLERDFVGVVEQFINKLQLKDFHIIGSSAGGWLALKMALANPNKVNKIIIQNTVGFADYMGLFDKVIGFYPLARLVAKTALKPTRENKNIEKFLRGIFYNSNLDLKPEFIEYFYETMATSHNLLFISRMTALTKQFLLEDKLKEVKNKTLIVWGENDKIMPLRKNSHNFSLIPDVKIEIFSNVGHIPSLENSTMFNETTLSFLGS